MKKLFYIANIRFPTERSHGIQVAHMCASFAKQMRRYDADMTQIGADTDSTVLLLVPDRETLNVDPFAYFGVERNFSVEKIPVPDAVRFGQIGFLLESLVFAYRAAKRVRVGSCTPLNPPSKEGGRKIIIYTREELPLLFLPRQSAFYEAHQMRRSSFFKRLIRRARGVIAISHGLKNALVAAGFPAERILVAHDGYDEKQFSVSVSKEEARRRLGLPLGTQTVMYIGGLEQWKGAETLCKAAASLAEDDILTVIIGGTGEEIRRLTQTYPAVRFLGARPYRELAVNQQAADILVIPNSATSELGSRFTSPLKLFAHMASSVLIVAANVPALAEVVNWSQAFPFIPDDPRDLARAIKRAVSSDFLSERLSRAREAEKRVRDFTWDMRARNVLAYIESLCQKEKKSS